MDLENKIHFSFSLPFSPQRLRFYCLSFIADNSSALKSSTGFAKPQFMIF